MPWHTTTDLDRFDAVAGDFLRTRPVYHTILLTTVDTVRTRGPGAYGAEEPRYGWWTSDESGVDGAFIRTPPHPSVVTDLPDDALPSFVDMAWDMGAILNAEQGLADRVTPGLTGVDVQQRTRLYRLDGLVPPPVVSGAARLARPADRSLLISWWEAFGAEVGGVHGSASAVVDVRIGDGGLVVWEDGGAVVSMAGANRPQVGVVRVGPVYTPVDLRGRGYAAAVTADVSRRALDRGHQAILFTDLANPTSNAIYQRLGYRPVQDRAVISFTGRAT